MEFHSVLLLILCNGMAQGNSGSFAYLFFFFALKVSSRTSTAAKVYVPETMCNKINLDRIHQPRGRHMKVIPIDLKTSFQIHIILILVYSDIYNFIFSLSTNSKG